MVEKFVKATGVDSLAISIGSSHGVVKVKPNPDGSIPELRFDILKNIEKTLPKFPIVLHGSSAIPAKYVNMLNMHGGELKHAQGIPEDQIRKAVKMSVCKVNVASDGWIAMTATTRKVLSERKDIIDPRAF
jgi:fructose-bisphosphate aldolase class II